MNPKIWGPVLWASLIYIVQTYPEQPEGDVQSAYLQFFQSLGAVLPCDICRKNYQRDFVLTSVNLSGRDQLLAWLLDLYNKSTQQKDALTLDQLVCKYTKGESGVKKATKNHKHKHNKNRARYNPAIRRR